MKWRGDEPQRLPPDQADRVQHRLTLDNSAVWVCQL